MNQRNLTIMASSLIGAALVCFIIGMSQHGTSVYESAQAGQRAIFFLAVAGIALQTGLLAWVLAVAAMPVKRDPAIDPTPPTTEPDQAS